MKEHIWNRYRPWNKRKKTEQGNGVQGKQAEAFLRLITLTRSCAKDGGKVCAING